MIVRKAWVTFEKRKGRFERRTWRVQKVGWFLLGFIPLYICQIHAEEL